MYKVFINDRPLLLTDQYPDLRSEAVLLYLKFDSNTTLREAIDMLEGENVVDKVVVYHHDLAELWETFRSNYEFVKAAGGVVTNPKGQRLFIFRNGLWDLPKGKLEAGESFEVAAVREVEEECGISGLALGAELSPTYHTYEHKGKHVLKITRWYTMQGEADALVPQTEEGIEEVRWVEQGEAPALAQQTYNSLKGLMLEGWEG